MDKNVAAMMIKAKSLGVAIVLTIIFGPLGLFYASITGGIVTSILAAVCFLISMVTLGLGTIVFIPLWIICVIWAIISVNSHNKKLINAA